MQRLDARTAALLTVPPLMWASNAIVGRLIVGSIPPLTFNALRWWVALALVLPLGWRVLRKPAQILRRARYFAVLGLLGVGCYNALQYAALESSSPINVTLIASSIPLWMLLVGMVMFRERPGARQGIGAALSLIGVMLVLTRGELAELARIRLVRGDLLMLLATTLWAVYSWMLVRPPDHLRGAQRPDWDWSGMLMMQMLFGVLWASAAAGIEQASGVAPIRWTPWTMAALAYVAIGPSLLAYRAWGAGVASAGPTTAALFQNLTPVFAALMSAALLGDPPHWYHGLAFAFIAAGIVLPLQRR